MEAALNVFSNVTAAVIISAWWRGTAMEKQQISLSVKVATCSSEGVELLEPSYSRKN